MHRRARAHPRVATDGRLSVAFGVIATSANEEALVILHGSGVASIEGHPDVPLTEKMLACIPPATRHNVTNNATQILECVWVVEPTNEAAK